MEWETLFNPTTCCLCSRNKISQWVPIGSGALAAGTRRFLPEIWLLTLQIVKFDNKSFKIPIDMLLVVELVELLVVEKLEESLVELRDVVPPVFVELHRHHEWWGRAARLRWSKTRWGGWWRGEAPLRARGEVALAEYGELSVRQIQSL